MLRLLPAAAGNCDWGLDAAKGYNTMQKSAESQVVAERLSEYARSVPPQLSSKEAADFTRAECDNVAFFVSN